MISCTLIILLLLLVNSNAELNNDTFVYYPGEIVIGALLPITRNGYGYNDTCLHLDLSGGFQALSSMLYMLDLINNTGNLKKKMGALVYNSFMDVDYGVKKSVAFIEKFIRDYRLGDPVKKNISIVMIGGNNDLTSRVNNLMKLFYLPVISFWSTSPELSSVRKNKNFLRTTPSDENSLSILVDILHHQNWTYINIFRDHSLYSSRLYTLFKKLAQSKYAQEICISNEVQIDELGRDFAMQIGQLKTEKRVGVNVVLASETKTFDMIEHIRETDSLRTDYVWIGLSNMIANIAAYDDRIKIKPLLNTTAILPYLYPSFEGITKSIISGQSINYNPWLPIYYKLRCGCSPSFSVKSYECLDKTIKLPICTYDKMKMCISKINKDFILRAQSPYIIQAIEAIFYTIVNSESYSIVNDGKGFAAALRQINFQSIFGTQVKFEDNDGKSFYSVISNSYYGNFVNIGFGYMNEDSKMTFKYQNDGQKLLSLSVPNSTCSDECKPGSSILFDRGSNCCWRCGPCSMSKYAKPIVDVKHKGRKIIEAECEFCDPGRQTNDHISCYDVELEYQSINMPFSIIILTISSIGLVILVIIVVIFALNWYTPIIKATGREMMILLFIGIALSFISSAVIVCFEPSKHLCNFANAMPSFCLTLCYGTLFAKILRILKVFQLTSDSKRVLRKFIDPMSQISFIMTMLMIQVIVLFIIIFYFEMNPILILTTKDESYKYTEDSDDTKTAYPHIEQVKRKVIYGLLKNKLVCIEKITLPLFATLIFPTVLIFVTAYYSFKARKVPDGFNETRALLFVNYAVCLFYIFMPVAAYFLQGTIYDVTPMAVLLQINGYATMLGIFTPKIYIILVTPEKNTKSTVMFRTKNSIVSIKELDSETRNELALSTNSEPEENDETPKLDLSYSLDSNVYYPIEKVISKRGSWEMKENQDKDSGDRVVIFKHKDLENISN